MTFIKYPTSKQLKADLNKKIFKTIYLFMGEEEGEKEKYINYILDIIFENEPDRKNCTARFHLENNEFMSAADFLLSPSIFYPRKACVLLNIDTFKPDPQGKALLKDIFEEISDSTTLIMTTPHNNPPAFFDEPFLEKISCYQFWRYFENDLNNYIMQNLNKVGIKIDKKAMEMIVELTGRDIQKVDEAIDILKNSAGGGIIDPETVKMYIHDVSNATIFEFVDSLYKKEKKAFKLLNKIIEEGSPGLLILNMIIRQAELMEKYYSAVDSGSSTEEALKKINVYSNKREDFWKYTKSFPSDTLKRAFTLMARTDYELKSGGRSNDLIGNPVTGLVSDMLFNI